MEWLRICVSNFIGWVVRVIGGFIPIDKPVGEWLGKIIWVMGLVLIFNFLSAKFTGPQNKNNIKQTAENITNVYHQENPKATFGCASIRVQEYYGKKPMVQQPVNQILKK